MIDATLSLNESGACVPNVTPSARARARRSLRNVVDPNSDEARCPATTTPCPIEIPVSGLVSQPTPTSKLSNSWECLNLKEELSSCGACHNDVCVFVPISFMHMIKSSHELKSDFVSTVYEDS